MSQSDYSSPGQMVLSAWQRVNQKPAGKWLFARMLKRFVPYSGSIGAVVEELTPGHCRVSLKDRRAVRNHLRSIHALALSNLGELCSGLAMLTQLPVNVQGIVTRIDTQYHKKARGTLSAKSECEMVAELTAIREAEEKSIQALIYDQDNDLVATVTVSWTFRPRQK